MLVNLLIALIVLGVLLWLIPMDDRIRMIIVAVAAIAAVLYLLRGSGFG